MQFVLASASPRRRELMSLISENFTVTLPETDESVISGDTPPYMYVQELALLKAAAAAKFHLKQKDAIIIAADTIVVADGKILGKPHDESDAKYTLLMLSGKTHSVYTGYCILRMSDAYTVCNRVKTDVTFRDLSEEKIDAYIRTGEPMDKAGAYGIQGKGSFLVSKIDGDYFNVVGFPVSDFAKTLEDDFDIQIF